MARSLNRVQLIGNLTRDPELRYTPSGTAVCSFSLATNRSWTTDTGEKHDETDFHRIVAWNKLGELCSQFLAKGRKVYVEGRLSTRNWTTQDNQQRTTTEIVIDDMILLDNKGAGQGTTSAQPTGGSTVKKSAPAHQDEPSEDEGPKAQAEEPSGGNEDEITPDDIPF